MNEEIDGVDEEKRKSYIEAVLLLRLWLEYELYKKVFSLFRTYAHDVYLAYLSFGLPYLSTDFKSKLESILRNHYLLYTKKLMDVNNKYIDSGLTKNALLSEITRATSKDIMQRAALASTSIIQTTNSELQKFVDTLINEANVTDQSLARKEIGTQVRNNILKRAKARSSTISITETTWAAETVSSAVFRAVLGNKFNINPKEVINEGATEQELSAIALMGFEAAYEAGYLTAKKTWVAVLDHATRPAHAAASGQTVKVNEPFIVWDEEIMYPGMGSYRNTVNCRCVVTYSQ